MLKAITNFQIYQNLFKYWFTLSHFALDDPVELDTHGYNCIQIVDSNLLLGFSRILDYYIEFFCVCPYCLVLSPTFLPFFLSAILATAEHILNTAWKNW